MRKQKEFEHLDHIDIIRRHCFTDEGKSIVLTQFQQDLLKKWETIIELRCVEMFTTKQIVDNIKEAYGISQPEAYLTIKEAEQMYAYNSNLSKRYRIEARINYLEEKIRDLYEKNFNDSAVSLESTLAKYYAMYPENKPKTPSKPLTFVLHPDQVSEQNTMPPEEAEAILLNTVMHGSGVKQAAN